MQSEQILVSHFSLSYTADNEAFRSSILKPLVHRGATAGTPSLMGGSMLLCLIDDVHCASAAASGDSRFERGCAIHELMRQLMTHKIWNEPGKADPSQASNLQFIASGT